MEEGRGGRRRFYLFSDLYFDAFSFFAGFWSPDETLLYCYCRCLRNGGDF
jgi:hypothetical protein